MNNIKFNNIKKKQIPSHFRINSELGNYIKLKIDFTKKTESNKKIEKLNSWDKIQEISDYKQKLNLKTKKLCGKNVFKTMRNYKKKYNLINKEINKNISNFNSCYKKFLKEKNKKFKIKIKKEIKKPIEKSDKKRVNVNTFFKIANFIKKAKCLSQKFTTSVRNNIQFSNNRATNISININSINPDNNELCTLDYINVLDNEYLVLYGGINNYNTEEIYYLNLKNYKWNVLNLNKDIISRYGHSSCIYDNRWIIYFGGQRNLNAKYDSNLLFNDLRVLNFEKKSIFSFKILSKNYPVGRKYHAAFLKKNEIFIQGGIDAKHNVLNDLWKGIIYFNRQSVFWSKYNYSNEELGTYKHSIFHIFNEYLSDKGMSKNLIYKFGGINEKLKINNDIYYFNINNKESNWWKLKQNFMKPSKRFGFKLIYSAKFEGLLLYGGKGEEEQVFNDLYLFSFYKKEWYKIDIYNKIPIRRYSFGITLQNSNLFIFGGIDYENQLRGHLEKIKIVKN